MTERTSLILKIIIAIAGAVIGVLIIIKKIPSPFDGHEIPVGLVSLFAAPIYFFFDLFKKKQRKNTSTSSTIVVAPQITNVVSTEERKQYSHDNTHEQNIKPETKSLENKPAKGYLRRRCRYIPVGSQEFKKIITELTTLKVADKIHDYDSRINALKPNFEQEIANAVYNENIGNIDNMIDILNSIKLKGKKENVRLLFLGIAYEKLDKIEEAMSCYNKILEKEDNAKLLKSAQFNIMLCREKGEDRSVDFTAFFKDNTILLGGQRIKDKALTMHLIVCQKNNKPFTHNNILNESLQYEFVRNPIGYVKTVLSYKKLNKSSLTQHEKKELMDISSEKSIPSRVAILVKLHNEIDTSDIQSRLIIKNILYTLKDKYPGYTIKKHISELN